MKNKLLTWVTTLVVAIVMVMGGSSAVFADTGETTGELSWGNKVETIGRYGVNSPVLYGDYIYVVSHNIVYKYNKDTGAVEDSITIDGEDGIKYNKTPATAADGKLFVQISNGKLAVIDISGIKMNVIKVVQFDNETIGDAYSPVTYSAADNAVYAGTRSGTGGIYAKIDLVTYDVEKMVASDYGFYWAGACAEGNYVVFGSDSDGTDSNKVTGNAVLYVYNKESKRTESIKLNDSGSIRSTVVKHGSYYYFTSKNKKLYRAAVDEAGKPNAEVFATLSGISTCTPVIENGKIYVGSQTDDWKGVVDEISLDTGAVVQTYTGAPADMKNLLLNNGNIYATYNISPGGIWDVKAGRDYFTPESNMQNYGISSIVKDSNDILYYTNDSNYLLAVKPAEKSDGGDDNKDPVVPDEEDKAGTADVYVTISSQGIIKLAQEKIKVKDIDDDGKLTVNDALYVAHENYYEGGAAAGYSSTFSAYGLSLNKLWGDNSGSFGYRVNNKSAWSLEDAVKDGDYVNAFIYKDSVGRSDLYTWFDKNFLSVKSGEQFTLSLYAAGYDEQWNEVVKPVKNAGITINGLPTVYRTNELGQVTFSIPEKGEYVISAESEIENLVSPICKVSVSDKVAAADQNDKATGDKSTDTGDDFNMIVVIIIALAAVSAAAVIIAKRRRV